MGAIRAVRASHQLLPAASLLEIMGRREDQVAGFRTAKDSPIEIHSKRRRFGDQQNLRDFLAADA